MFLKKQDAGKTNGTTKGAQVCATPGCHNTANPSTGLCFPCECGLGVTVCKTPGCHHVANGTGYCDLCELEYAQFAKEAADWWALRDAAEAAESGWARRQGRQGGRGAQNVPPTTRPAQV